MFDEERLEARLAELRNLEINDDWLEWFGGWLRGAEPAELTRIRPGVLAAELGADLHYFLKLLVGAVKVGLLDLHWEHFCPT